MKQETMPGSGYFYVVEPTKPHLGGNIHGGDVNCASPSAWDYLIKTFNIKSVLDVGCGEGHALAYFISKGCTGLGVEGLPENAANCVAPVYLHDLTGGPFVTAKTYDLVWCCEVVEHVEEKYLENLLGTLCNAKVVAMTHATPGQGGHHHVNCQHKEYWIGHMRRKGYVLEMGVSEEARALERDAAEKTRTQASYFGRSGLVFVRL